MNQDLFLYLFLRKDDLDRNLDELDEGFILCCATTDHLQFFYAKFVCFKILIHIYIPFQLLNSFLFC